MVVNEDACVTLGNTGGMGAVVSSQPSSIPGDVAGSTRGSGDISAVDNGSSFGIPKWNTGGKKGRKKGRVSTKRPATAKIKSFKDFTGK